MADVADLLADFEAGRLIRPSADQTSLVDVARAIASVCGVEQVRLDDHSRAIADHLRRAEHLVLLLIDGLGINFVDALPRSSWLRRNTLRSIHAPFPSTTPVAITSIATAEYPAVHSVTGWWTYVPRIGDTSTVFQHDRARDGVGLDTLGVEVRDLLPGTPVIPRMRRDAALVMPQAITDSVYTRWMAGDATCIGYSKHDQAVEIIANRIREASGPTFTYWYTPLVDTLAHQLGSGADRVKHAVAEVDAAAAGLQEALADGDATYRIVATADHGHLDIDPHLEVAADDGLIELLAAPPSGDLRAQFWHVRPGEVERFGEAFRERFGEWFYLAETREVSTLALLGPDAVGAETRARMGDCVSIARGSAALRFAGYPGHDHYREMRSAHSGLTADEMLVPLIVAGGEAPPADRVYR